MAHFQNQYGAVPPTDEYGNQIRQTDEYGNPIYHSATTGDYGTGSFDTTTETGMRGHSGTRAAGTDVVVGYDEQGHRGLHRSGSSSSSSSSSEDDGQGGRRKKRGLKEKIKEKLPGVGHKDDRTHTSATTTPGGYSVTGEGQHQHHHHDHEKKGMMEKIKEKLPGHHH